MLTLPMVARPWYSSASSSRMGAIILHGPHHSAQKSSSTGLSDFRTSWENVASVVCTMCGLLTRFNLRRMQSVGNGLFWIGKLDVPHGSSKRGARQTVTLTREVSTKL